MKREEALQIIYDHCQHCDETEKAFEILKENKGEWIPVSERLPNLDDYTGSEVWQKKC